MTNNYTEVISESEIGLAEESSIISCILQSIEEYTYDYFQNETDERVTFTFFSSIGSECYQSDSVMEITYNKSYGLIQISNYNLIDDSQTYNRISGLINRINKSIKCGRYSMEPDTLKFEHSISVKDIYQLGSTLNRLSVTLLATNNFIYKLCEGKNE